MNFLHAENRQNTLYTITKVLLPFTFIYKTWYLAELQYNTIMLERGLLGRIMEYAICGMVAYLLAMLAISLSFRSLYKSRYAPFNEESVCRINKSTYYNTAYFVICVINILCGSLNFIAYTAPISTSFIVIFMPQILSIFTVCGIIGLLCLECKKGEFRQLLTSMALPSIILLILLR